MRLFIAILAGIAFVNVGAWLWVTCVGDGLPRRDQTAIGTAAKSVTTAPESISPVSALSGDPSLAPPSRDFPRPALLDVAPNARSFAGIQSIQDAFADDPKRAFYPASNATNQAEEQLSQTGAENQSPSQAGINGASEPEIIDPALIAAADLAAQAGRPPRHH